MGAPISHRAETPETSSPDREHVVADVRTWSEASRVVLADVADGLERLEAAGSSIDRDARHLLRFRHALFAALRELHARDDVFPARRTA